MPHIGCAGETEGLHLSAAAFARRTHFLAGCESASTPVRANRLRIPRRWAWILLLSFFDISFHLVGVEGGASLARHSLDPREIGTLTVFFPSCTRCSRTLTKSPDSVTSYDPQSSGRSTVVAREQPPVHCDAPPERPWRPPVHRGCPSGRAAPSGAPRHKWIRLGSGGFNDQV